MDWFCPDTEHSEAPELNLDVQELSDTSSDNEFNSTFPLWQRKRVEFMYRIFNERREHISQWLQENGIQTAQAIIKYNSIFYAIAYYEREKTRQILRGFTARVNNCGLMEERPETICDYQAPTPKDIYEQYQAIWQSLYGLLGLWERSLRIHQTVKGRK